MSIRSGILVVLSASDAYGLQIHAELEGRTDRAGRINVGQIYSTLDRLTSAGLVVASGATDDGLPLHRVTPAGRAAATEWLHDVDVDSPAAWSDMTFRVLLATSLRSDAIAVVTGYRTAWAASLAAETTEAVSAPARIARQQLAHAAVTWLDAIQALPGGLEALQRPLRHERPRRGRRPSPPQE